MAVIHSSLYLRFPTLLLIWFCPVPLPVMFLLSWMSVFLVCSLDNFSLFACYPQGRVIVCRRYSRKNNCFNERRGDPQPVCNIKKRLLFCVRLSGQQKLTHRLVRHFFFAFYIFRSTYTGSGNSSVWNNSATPDEVAAAALLFSSVCSIHVRAVINQDVHQIIFSIHKQFMEFKQRTSWPWWCLDIWS